MGQSQTRGIREKRKNSFAGKKKKRKREHKANERESLELFLDKKGRIKFFKTCILLISKTTIELWFSLFLRGGTISKLPELKYSLILRNNSNSFTWFSNLNLGTCLFVENEPSPSINPPPTSPA